MNGCSCIFFCAFHMRSLQSVIVACIATLVTLKCRKKDGDSDGGGLTSLKSDTKSLKAVTKRMVTGLKVSLKVLRA